MVACSGRSRPSAAAPWSGCSPSSRQMPPRCSRSTTAVFKPELRRADRGDIAAGAGADDDDVVGCSAMDFLRLAIRRSDGRRRARSPSRRVFSASRCDAVDRVERIAARRGVEEAQPALPASCRRGGEVLAIRLDGMPEARRNCASSVTSGCGGATMRLRRRRRNHGIAPDDLRARAATSAACGVEPVITAPCRSTPSMMMTRSSG